MSRIGKNPIPIPSSVNVTLTERMVTVAGPKGSLTWEYPTTAMVVMEKEKSRLIVTRMADSKQSRANHGLTRALIANMVTGVEKGFERRLLIYGTGYNCKLEGGKLHLNVGFSGRRHGLGSQFELAVPNGLEVVIEKPAARGDTEPASLLIRGFDKQQVGQFASEIRSYRKTEPYKNKGIRYEGEQVRRKQGKSLTGAG